MLVPMFSGVLRRDGGKSKRGRPDYAPVENTTGSADFRIHTYAGKLTQRAFPWVGIALPNGREFDVSAILEHRQNLEMS